MHTVVARFHHPSRDLAEIEADPRARGADDAQITGYVVAMTLDAESHADAAHAAKRMLDKVGASHIKITKRGAKHAMA